MKTYKITETDKNLILEVILNSGNNRQLINVFNGLTSLESEEEKDQKKEKQIKEKK